MNALRRRLASARRPRLASYRLETDVIECYSRIHQLGRRIARLVAIGVRERAPAAAPGS